MKFPWLIAGGILAGLASMGVKSAMARIPQDIFNAVAQVDPEHNPSLQRGAPPAPKLTDTWCNKAVALITALLGCPIPFGQWGTLANAQILWLQAGNDGWYQAAGREDAQAAAMLGHVVIATYYNPSGNGHMAIVLPIDNGDGQLWTAQAGAVNFNQDRLERGFGAIEPVFFIHA